MSTFHFARSLSRLARSSCGHVNTAYLRGGINLRLLGLQLGSELYTDLIQSGADGPVFPSERAAERPHGNSVVATP